MYSCEYRLVLYRFYRYNYTYLRYELYLVIKIVNMHLEYKPK